MLVNFNNFQYSISLTRAEIDGGLTRGDNFMKGYILANDGYFRPSLDMLDRVNNTYYCLKGKKYGKFTPKFTECGEEIFIHNSAFINVFGEIELIGANQPNVYMCNLEAMHGLTTPFYNIFPKPKDILVFLNSAGGTVNRELGLNFQMELDAHRQILTIINING